MTIKLIWLCNHFAESEDNKSENQSTVEKKEGSDVKIDRKSETNSDFKENVTKQDKEGTCSSSFENCNAFHVLFC